jgi:anti-sigma factor RsiW
MSECHTIAAQVAGYVDDELSAPARQQVADHLAACAPCREAEAVQRQARAVLRAHAGSLREAAPPTLRAAVSRRPTLVQPTAPRRAATWRWMPLPAAAALVIALAGVVAVGALAPRGSVQAAQLTLDHLKCALITHDRPHEQPEEAAAQWKQRRGWDVAIPPSAPDGELDFVALRRCLYSDGEVAHLIYQARQGGDPVSLFVLPRVRQSVPELGIMGHNTVTWVANGRSYAVVGALPAAELQRAVAYFQAHVR